MVRRVHTLTSTGRRPMLPIVTGLLVAVVAAVVLLTWWRSSSEMLFYDDFEGTQLNRSAWTPQRGLPPHTYGSPFNPEVEDTFFEPGQVSVSDGALRLRLESRNVTDPLGGARYSHVSGVVHTGASFSFTYGYAEARILIPQGEGLWPAWWMLPTPVDERWPPEIDITELTDVSASSLPTFNVHYIDDSGATRQVGPISYSDAAMPYVGAWHDYGLQWEPGRIAIFVDGQEVGSHEGPEVPSGPMYLVLGMGAERGTSPPASELLVDRVLVRQRRE